VDNCQPTLSTVEKGKSLVDITHISDDSNDKDNEEDEKVLNLVPSSSNTSDLPPFDKVDGVEIMVNEKECSEIPSDNDICEQLNERQGIASQLDACQKIKIYQISALQWLLTVCGHSELARFVRNNLFITRRVDCPLASYYGDIVFKLPPIRNEAKRGDRV
jgi:hypothetical protein